MANRCSRLRAVLGLLTVMSGSVAAQLTPDQTAALAEIRDYALTYTEKLPNYTATQVVQRRVRPTQQGRYTMGSRTQTETVEEQIGYVDRRELHKILTVNGQKVKEGDNDQGGMYSRGEFALLLATIFRPETKTTFRWDRTATLNKRKMMVFAFQVPQLPNGYVILEGSRGLVVAYKGSVYADAETKAVMRIQFTCTDIPSVSHYEAVSLTLDYKALKVAGQEFILPSQYTMNLRRADADVTIEANYRNYQRFTADATIIFDEEPTSVH